MARTIRKTFTPAAASLTGFASNVTGATWTLTTTATSDGYAHQVSIRNDAATDHSGKTAVLVGTDADGKAISETVTLPGASATVESTLYFKTLTSITPSATINADTMDVGWVDEFVSQTFPLDLYFSAPAVNVAVTGTINYTVQQTFDDAFDPTVATSQGDLTWASIDYTAMVSATTSQNAGYLFIPPAVRLVVNSYSTGATITMNIVQART